MELLPAVPPEMEAVGAELANAPVIVLAAVTAVPVVGLDEPDMYPPDQLENLYPVLALAVPLTVSPYRTVNVALAPALATALVP